MELYNSTGKNLIVNSDGGLVGIGTTQPGNPFTVVADIPGTANTGAGTAGEDPENYVARIRNSTDLDPWNDEEAGVLALMFDRNLNTSSEEGKFNWIQFFEGGQDLAGSIQNNADGDIVFKSNGADYAERLERLDPNEVIDHGDVVGVFGGKITKRTNGADWVMVTTGQAIIVGNASLNDPELHARQENVSFIGQIPVRVRGRVAIGDYLIASGNNDGVAVAVSSSAITPAHAHMIVGRAWESSDQMEEKRINAVVGLPQASSITGALYAQVEDQQRQIHELRERIKTLESIEQRLSALESQQDLGLMQAGYLGESRK